MTTPPNLAPKPPILSEHTGRRSPIVPAVITFFGALLLTGGSVFGYISTCSNSGPSVANTLFKFGTLVGLALFCGAAIWLVLLLVWYSVQAIRGLLD